MSVLRTYELLRFLKGGVFFNRTFSIEIVFKIFGRIQSNKCFLEAKFKILRETIIRKVVSEVFKTVTFAFVIKNGANNQP